MPDFPTPSPNKKMDMRDIDINIPIETSPIKQLHYISHKEDDFYDPVASPVGSDNNNIHEYGEEHSFA